MKLLYISSNDINDKSSGVAKKIRGQSDSMRRSGIDVYNIFLSGDYVFFDKKTLANLSRIPLISYFYRTYILYKYSYNIIREYDFKYIYIRYSISDLIFLRFLKRVKQLGCKVFLEFPTYPYDNEYKSKRFPKNCVLLIDVYCRKYLKLYVDKVFSTSDVNEIFGIRSISFDNGIDSKYVPKRDYDGGIKNSLRLISVANLAVWHGYDRVIRGIKDYYDKGGKYHIRYNIVGDGPDYKRLFDLVKEFKLEDKVIFYGRLSGKDLDDVYDISDLAIETLSASRRFDGRVSSLKSREACLKGIPFVSTYGLEDSFGNNFKYRIQIEDNENPVDIGYLIKEMESFDSKEYIPYMRNFAEKNFSWDVQFKNVIKEIKKYESS